MKKFLLGLALFVFLLLSALYLAVNSPYVIDTVARKFAPQYHVRYDRIEGNPLRGITLENLYYKDRKLARKIRIRINPYTLLQKRVTISRLDLLDVDVPVLEGAIRDFTASSTPEEKADQSSSGALPVAIEAQNIRLSLLPFKRYGVSVDREELRVDSIYYDAGVFNVGRLKQIAHTSLGTVELEGTYHKRFLDVDLLAVEDLDLVQLQTFLQTIGVTGTTQPSAPAAQQPQSADRTQESSDEDPFLPAKIHAKKLWLTLKPYDWEKKLHLEWAQVEGNGLQIDLQKSRLTGGSLSADLSSDLGSARFRAHFDPHTATLDEGVFDGVDLQKILTLAGIDANASSHPDDSKEAQAGGGSRKLEPLDRIPFVPPALEVKRLRVELRPGKLEGIDYRNPVLNVEDLHADLHRNRLEVQHVGLNLDTPMMHLNLDASIDEKAIWIHQIDLQDLDIDAIRRYAASESNRTEASRPGHASTQGKSSTAKRAQGVTPPFVPSILVLQEGRVDLKPFTLDPLQLRQAHAALKNIRFDLSTLRASRGGVRLDLQSNLADGRIEGSIQDNRLLLTDTHGGVIRLKKKLFQKYGLPLRAEAFSPIHMSGDVDPKALHLRLSFDAHQILADQNGSLNVDINRSLTTVNYDFAKSLLDVEHQSRIALPQAPEIRLEAKLFQKEGALRYRAHIHAGRLKLGDDKIEKMLGIPKIDLQGDLHRLRAKLDAGIFGGTFVSADLKKGELRVGTKKALKAANYFKLPQKLADARLDVQTITPIDFAKPLPLQSKVTVRSNLADLDGTLRYDGNLSAKILARFPKKSLLEALLPKLKVQALDPLKLSVKQLGKLWDLKLTSKHIAANFQYATQKDRLQGTISVAGTKIKVEGKPKETIHATLQSPSVKKLIGNLTAIYAIEIPKLDGDLNLDLKIEKLSRATLELRSKKFVPDDTARIKSPIKNIQVLLAADRKKQSLTVQSYHLEVSGMKFFATKPSIVRLQKQRLSLETFWINDSLKVAGAYDLKKKKGRFTAKSSRFKIDHENAKLDASVDLDAKIDGQRIDVKGKIFLLGGNVMYNLQAKHYASDDDIVILQHRKKNEGSFFRKNVQLNLYIEAKKPLLFKQKNVHVELKPQLSILKGYDGDLQVLGSVSLAKGGYYIFEGKRFVLKPSSVDFTGKATEPLLDIHLIYRRYSKTIYITVSGKATQPNLNFSSDPYMNRNQILSFILFDTEDSGNSGSDMLSLVGGGIAKSILGNLGLKVDTLVLNSSGFEVGKQITDRISVIYDQGDESKVIVRIKTFKHTQTDISIGEESQSVDIIYKREF